MNIIFGVMNFNMLTTPLTICMKHQYILKIIHISLITHVLKRKIEVMHLNHKLTTCKNNWYIMLIIDHVVKNDFNCLILTSTQYHSGCKKRRFAAFLSSTLQSTQTLPSNKVCRNIESVTFQTAFRFSSVGHTFFLSKYKEVLHHHTHIFMNITCQLQR